ncbi:unnamed protein product [Nippostrongylus brasiliensis]|uniref:CULLIN_2 domain-containing protein n=1 Tax=Nippostrongylus brasiliensis TaxID=27835 RepID=A0A0N4YHL6_NIPBR|nr:unnamed protein product [Nippostrongylus brasiliensis]
MSDLSDEMLSDEESAEMFRQAFNDGEPEYMFEQLIEGPNEEQFDHEKERDESNESLVDVRAARQTSRGLPTVKKLTIKNFRRKNDDVADLMATGWLTLEASINAIQTKQHVTTNLEQLYKVDRYLLKALLRMLRTLDLYKQAFEEEFLTNTSVHYTHESMSLVRSLETVDFLLYVERRIKEENERIDLYLDESTRTPLLTRAEKCLISDHMQEVVDNGLPLLLNDNRVSDVSRLYALLCRVDGGVALLKTGFSSFIKKVGQAMIMDLQRDQTMVEDLMAFKDKLDVFVETCFGSGEDKMKFAQAEKDAFDYFINTRGNKPAELIAKYMDARLRSANKEASDEQLDQLMNKVITLFRFIQGKDVFEVFYKKDLAKRLLLGRSASVDAEKIMLSKLRQECGAGFTQKLEGMFRDMELSKDLGVAFRNVNVPHHLSCSLQLYEKFYDSRHTGRKLQWQPRLGQCVLKANFRRGVQKELKVSLFQAIVLLLFNDQQSWSAADIVQATKLDQKEFVRTMVSLSCAKVRVLVKSPMNKEIKDDDVFTVNTDIKEMRFRIRISEVQMKETEEEYKAVEEEVNQDRQYQIDAAIVRVMKTRKKLNHQLLISELFAQLRFPVRAADLKKRIGSLMERDYLRRCDEDPNLYQYVA